MTSTILGTHQTMVHKAPFDMFGQTSAPAPHVRYMFAPASQKHILLYVWIFLCPFLRLYEKLVSQLSEYNQLLASQPHIMSWFVKKAFTLLAKHEAERGSVAMSERMEGYGGC